MEAVLALLLSDTRDEVARLFAEPLMSYRDLGVEVARYLGGVKADPSPALDRDLAWSLGQNLLALLGEDAKGPLDHRLVQVATRYFVAGGDRDDRSYFAFDDDAEVFNACVEVMGRKDLLVA